MPLALLLQNNINILAKGVKKLAPWHELVYLEELLLDRVRSAFIVYWFGKSLPISKLSLRIAIINLDPLRRRYLAVKAASKAPDVMGVNLTEPMAGFTGTLAGMLMSPVGFTVVAAVALRYLWSLGGKWLTILSIIIGIILGPIATVIGLAVGGLGLVGGPILALMGAGSPLIQSTYRFLGTLAGFLNALRRLLRQLLGPRSGVKNPLLRPVLELGDQLAALLPHLIALFAFLITRVGPELRPLTMQLPHFYRLVQAVIQTIVFIYQDLVSRLQGLYKGGDSPWSILKSIFGRMGGLLRTLFKGFGGLFSKISTRFKEWADSAKDQLKEWWLAVKPMINAVTVDHPVIKTISALIKAVKEALRLFKKSGVKHSAGSKTSAPPSKPSFSSQIIKQAKKALTPPSLPSLPSKGKIQKQLGAPPPELSLGAITSLAELIAILHRQEPGLVPDPFVLSPAAKKAVRRASYPPSIFAAERRKLRDAQDRTVAQQLALLREKELPYRQLLLAVVQRVLPTAAASKVTVLEQLFKQIDENIYQYKTQQRAELPVRQLDENNRLRPVVKHLRVRATGTKESRLIDWVGKNDREGLRKALNDQIYLAHAV